jgi:hypothetical protein
LPTENFENPLPSRNQVNTGFPDSRNRILRTDPREEGMWIFNDRRFEEFGWIARTLRSSHGPLSFAFERFLSGHEIGDRDSSGTVVALPGQRGKKHACSLSGPSHAI